MPGDTSKFYAAFTTGASDGLVGSAICTFTMEDIQDAFAGRFKEQVSYLIQTLSIHINTFLEPLAVLLLWFIVKMRGKLG